RPCTKRSASQRTLVTDLVSHLIEKGVVHRGGSALIDHRKPTVAIVCVSPDKSGEHLLCAVVLSAADRDKSIRWVNGNALKLSSVKTGVVECGPGYRGIGRFPDSTVISMIENV